MQDTPLTITECLRLVSQFHQLIKAGICQGSPQLLLCNPERASYYGQRLLELSQVMAGEAGCTQDQLLGRGALAVEELGEWMTAHSRLELVAAADALADRLYVLLGDAVATGLPLEELFAEVHRSNLTKLPFIQTGHGRGAKGPDYQRPDIARVLRESEQSGVQPR
jgi:predicted HAD superfamily Cof-like phosphohydrolase